MFEEQLGFTEDRLTEIRKILEKAAKGKVTYKHLCHQDKVDVKKYELARIKSIVF